MKKCFVILLSLILIISPAIFSANATYTADELSIKQELNFSDSDFKNKTEEEIFEEKLSAAQIPEKYYAVIPQNAYDRIVASNSIIVNSSYYVESDDGEGIVQTNKTNYDVAVKKEKERINQIKQQLASFNQDNILTNGSIVVGSPGVSEKINKGTLHIIMILVPSDDLSYFISAIFNWETLPSGRHTDAFGISRGANCDVIPQSAEGVYTQSYTTTIVSATEVIEKDYTSVAEFDFTDLKASPDGYAMEFNLGKDTTLPNVNNRIVYTAVMGSISYEGLINSTSATSVNHWATYAHKKLNLIFNGINFDVSFIGGFDISGLLGIDSTYDQLVDEHLWQFK